MSRLSHSISHHRDMILPRKGMGRMLLALVMLMGFAGQLLLITASLPEESPRAAILRLTGIDIAPSAEPAAMQVATKHAKGAEGSPKAGHNPASTPARTAPRTLERPTSSAQVATSTAPPSLSAGEDVQAGRNGGHRDMLNIGTPRKVDHTAPHAGRQGVHYGIHHHHHHHHGLDCPLCPLLGHIIFALACLAVLLGYARLSRQLWQDGMPEQAPAEPAYQRPPSRGPPHFILTNAIA